MEGAVRQAAGGGAPWLLRVARLGYAARGVVYVTLALIALQAAMGNRRAQGQSGALREIASQPAGQFLLALIALGLFGYAAWRLIEAAQGTEGEGSDGKGMLKRAGHALSGLIYGALGFQALGLARGASNAGGGDGSRAQDWTARLMELPAGRVLVALVGLGVLAYAAHELRRAVRGKVAEHLDLHELVGPARENVVRLGRAGVGARGVVFVITGGFLLLAALRSDPGQVTGLAGALETLHAAPWGPWLLGLVALGLLAFGLFQIVQARYRVLQPVA